MNAETKEVLDYLLAFLAPGAAGGLLLGLFGWMKARQEKPHIAPAPTLGVPALTSLGGVLMGQQVAQDIIDGINGLTASISRCAILSETEAEARKREIEEARDHERKMADDRHREHRELIDAAQVLANRLRDMRT